MSTAEQDFVSRLRDECGAELQRFLMQQLGDRQVAEEVAQETWLQLHQLARPEEVISAPALLFDVAAKLVSRHWRRTRAEAAIDIDIAAMEAVPDEAARPDQRVASEQMLEQLVRIADRLPPKLQDVLVMRCVEQMSFRDIAECLGISAGAAKMRATRAMDYCRERLLAIGLDFMVD